MTTTGVSPVSDLVLVCSLGAFSAFLSTVPENYFLTHLLITENHKPVVMLPPAMSAISGQKDLC